MIQRIRDYAGTIVRERGWSGIVVGTGLALPFIAVFGPIGYCAFAAAYLASPAIGKASNAALVRVENRHPGAMLALRRHRILAGGIAIGVMLGGLLTGSMALVWGAYAAIEAMVLPTISQQTYREAEASRLSRREHAGEAPHAGRDMTECEVTGRHTREVDVPGTPSPRSGLAGPKSAPPQLHGRPDRREVQ